MVRDDDDTMRMEQKMKCTYVVNDNTPGVEMLDVSVAAFDFSLE